MQFYSVDEPVEALGGWVCGLSGEPQTNDGPLCSYGILRFIPLSNRVLEIPHVVCGQCAG